jgi:hypothetical protein
VYASDVQGQRLNFAVSGMLWNRSLVMQDRETKSLWSHILGEAMDGPLQGTLLEIIPSHMTDWGTWRKLHPATTVVNLSRTSQEYRTEFYRDPDHFVLGLILEGERPRAWSFADLKEAAVVNEEVGTLPVLVAFDPASHTAMAFERRASDRLLTFRERGDGKLMDEQTASVWDRLTGRALEGPMAGNALKPLPAIVSYTTSWIVFHPQTEGLSEQTLQNALQRIPPPRRFPAPGKDAPQP